MIKQEILDKLSPITEEEREILHGHGVDKSIYTTTGGSVIRSKKLLVDGKLISIRKHTRFIHFPKHTHDYIEAVYMCAGETTHIINGKEITLNAPRGMERMITENRNNCSLNGKSIFENA